MISVTRNEFLDNLTLPEEIQDVISYEQVNTNEFIQDENNIIFMIDDNFYGFQKYFLPLKDEFIVFDCGNEGFGSLLAKYNNGTLQHLVNLEKIGLKLPYDENLGILIDMKEFLACFNTPGLKIAKIYRDNELELITRITSKAFLLNPNRVGAVSSAHCQVGYMGCIFNIKSLVNKNEYVIKGLDKSDITISKNTFIRCNEFSQCKYKDDYRLLLEASSKNNFYINTTEKNRLRLKELEFKNPFDLPQEYYEIYEEEKTFREYDGFSNLIEIDEIINININNIGNIIINGIDLFDGFSIEFNDDFVYLSDTQLLSYFPLPNYKKMTRDLFEEVKNWIDTNPSVRDRLKINLNDDLFLNFLSNHPKIKEHVVIAGGYALSYASKKYLDKDIRYKDIDLFLYNLDNNGAKEICNEIIALLYDFALLNPYTNIKQFKLSDNENCITILVNNKIIQIIKRIYKSPSHVIHGFDIDCCCILIELQDKKIFTTKRGLYSIKNQLNVYNFDRLSNSYDYRIIKYLTKRGYSIYLPGLDKLINNVNINFQSDDENLGFKFIKVLLYYANNKVSDYDINKTKKNISPEEINYTFSTLNPNEQANNTFQRIVMEDGYKFYPQKNPNLFDVKLINKSDPNLINEYIRFDKKDFKLERADGYNIFTPVKKLKEFTGYNIFLDTLRKFNLSILGDFAHRCLIDKKIKFNNINFLMYERNYNSVLSKAFEIIQHMWEVYFLDISILKNKDKEYIKTIYNNFNKNTECEFKIGINFEDWGSYKKLFISINVEEYINPSSFYFYFDFDDEIDILKTLKSENDDLPLMMYQDGTFICNKLTYNEIKYIVRYPYYDELGYKNTDSSYSEILKNRDDLLKYFTNPRINFIINESDET
jgi:hypothetical protein